MVERYGVGQKCSGGAEVAARAGDSGELGVVPWFACQAGQVHGKEDCVGSDQGGPEVEAAEGFGHETARARARCGDERKPVVGRRVETEDAGHRHDEVEVGYDEEGVVEVLVEDWLCEDGAGEASGDEEADEAEGEEHWGGEACLGWLGFWCAAR